MSSVIVLVTAVGHILTARATSPLSHQRCAASQDYEGTYDSHEGCVNGCVDPVINQKPDSLYISPRGALFADNEELYKLVARMEASQGGQGTSEGSADLKSGKGKLHRPKKTNFRAPKGPRPFDPESEAAKISLEEHIEHSVRITEQARQHQRQKLENEGIRKKRISTLNRSFIEHKKNQDKGLTPEDNTRTTVLSGLKKQELDLLKAFKPGTEEAAMYKLLEINFLNKMFSGPAYHRAGLEKSDREAVKKYREKCLEAFRKENSAGS